MKNKSLRIKVSEKFVGRVDRESNLRGLNRSQFIRNSIEKELPNPKEVIIMTREEMIKEITDEKVLINAEWLEENDSEMLDWITSSKYWGKDYEERPDRSEAVVELHFNENGVEYYADLERSKDDYPSQNQPPWGEDSWKDWEVQDIKKYYMLVKNNG